jgi:hypothetical protein
MRKKTLKKSLLLKSMNFHHYNHKRLHILSHFNQIHVYNSYITCPLGLEAIPARNIRDFDAFYNLCVINIILLDVL